MNSHIANVASKEPEIEVTPAMIEAAMEVLWRYADASEYVDRDMMREILRGALSRTNGAAHPV